MSNEKTKPDADDSEAKNPKEKPTGKKVTTEVKVSDGILRGFHEGRSDEAARAFAAEHGVSTNDAYTALNEASTYGKSTVKVSKASK
jgi:hypothetical protein